MEDEPHGKWQKPWNVNIRRSIFQGDSLSPLLFVIALTPLSMVLWKVTAGYGMMKGRCKINHLLFMDDLKFFAKNKEGDGVFGADSEDSQ